MKWPWIKAPPPAPAPAAPKPERKIVFSEETIAALRRRPRPEGPFVIPKPMPGVVPDSAPKMAQDSAISSVYGWANQNDHYGNLAWPGYAILSELTQRAEYRLVSETYAKEMTRKWVKLLAAGDESKTDKIKLLVAALKNYKVQDAFRRAAELDGFFGRAHIYLDTGATNDTDELRTPLLIKKQKIGLGGLKRLKIVEPIWTYPGVYNSSDPLDKNFYKPETWWVMGKEVHSSRLLTFIGREMPDMLKPAYMFGGLSRSQMIQPYVDFWLRDRRSVSDLINNFSKDVVKSDLSTLMQTGSALGLAGRIAAYTATKENNGTLLLDKDTEDFVNVSTPLGTLDQLQAQAQEHISSAAQIPLVKLLGISPAGLNASSDGEIRSFYDSVEATQRDMFDEPFEQVCQVIQLSEFGEIDPEITHEFVSLWSLDEAGKAAVRKTNADTAAVYMQEGVVSGEEVREYVATDPESLFAGLDLQGLAPGLPETGNPDLNDPSEAIERQGESGSETGANSGV